MRHSKFSYSSKNIFSVVALLAGITMFSAGVSISETNAKDMQKQTDKNLHQVMTMENSLSKQMQQTEYYKKQAEQEQSALSLLLKENDDLKKQVTTYRNGSELPSPVKPVIHSVPVVIPVKPVESPQRKVNVIATAYTSSCGGCSGVTATGINVRNTTKYNGATVIATDPRLIPLHSKVRIDTESGQSIVAVVEDTGGAIKGGKIDVLVSSYGEAISFGRQHATITILREGA